MYGNSYHSQKPCANRCSKEQAARTASKLKLSLTLGVPHLLVLIGPDTAHFALSFLETVYIGDDRDSEISVVCAKNRNLSRQLNERLGSIDNIHLYDTADSLPLLLDSADLLVTEPYEQIIFEAATRKIPIVITKDIPKNSCPEFAELLEKGCMAVCRNDTELADCSISLLQDDTCREQMKQMYRSVLLWEE